MNGQELLWKACTGHVMLVGELRAADVKESGQVDKKSGLAMTTWMINYFVELPRDDGLRVTKSKSAFLISTQILGKQSLYMWTFTFAEVLNIKDTRKRWNHLLTLMRQRWEQLCGIRIFEMHEFHGLHVHLVTNRFLDVNAARVLAKQAGWGRIDVRQIPIERAAYLAKYLSKERPPCLKRWRLWAGFGEWDWTRVKDLITQSRISTIYRACKEWLGWTVRKGFFERMKFVAWLEFRSAVEGWIDGCGPGGKPLWMCCREELVEGSTLEMPF